MFVANLTPYQFCPHYVMFLTYLSIVGKQPKQSETDYGTNTSNVCQSLPQMKLVLCSFANHHKERATVVGNSNNHIFHKSDDNTTNTYVALYKQYIKISRRLDKFKFADS